MRGWKGVVTGAAVLVATALSAPAANAAAPVTATLAATNITSTSAVLHGTVNNSTPNQPYSVPPYAFPTTYTFIYGQTIQYGSQTTTQSLPASTATQSVSATITGLTPNTPYHFRLIAINSQGEVGTGADAAFTTAPKPARRHPSLTLKVRPTHDSTAPFKYAMTGRLRLPSGVTKAQGCSGKVTIRVRRGSRTVKAGTAKVSRSCTYHKRLTIPTSRLAASGKLRIRAHFTGNSALLTASRSTTVRYG